MAQGQAQAQAYGAGGFDPMGAWYAYHLGHPALTPKGGQAGAAAFSDCLAGAWLGIGPKVLGCCWASTADAGGRCLHAECCLHGKLLVQSMPSGAAKPRSRLPALRSRHMAGADVLGCVPAGMGEGANPWLPQAGQWPHMPAPGSMVPPAQVRL